jgi:hypothetical protein
LPKEFKNLKSLFCYLEKNNIINLNANLIEQYPEFLELKGKRIESPKNLSDLISESPYYDSQKLLRWRKDRYVPRRFRGSASARLIKKFRSRFKQLNVGKLTMLKPYPVRTPVIKTPVFKSQKDNFLVGSHYTSLGASKEILLALLHFKFTSDSTRKISEANESKSYYKSSQKYIFYDALFSILINERVPLTFRKSKKLISIDELITDKLIIPPRGTFNV